MATTLTICKPQIGHGLRPITLSHWVAPNVKQYCEAKDDCNQGRIQTLRRYELVLSWLIMEGIPDQTADEVDL